jgi:hypothetical protein
MSTLKNYKDQSVNLHCIRAIQSIIAQREKLQKPNSEKTQIRFWDILDHIKGEV